MIQQQVDEIGIGAKFSHDTGDRPGSGQIVVSKKPAISPGSCSNDVEDIAVEAHIAVVRDKPQPHSRSRCTESADNLGCPIGRSIVRDDEFRVRGHLIADHCQRLEQMLASIQRWYANA